MKTHQDTAGSTLHHLHHTVIDRILVLLEPSSNIVRHDAGIVGDGKVSTRVGL